MSCHSVERPLFIAMSSFTQAVLQCKVCLFFCAALVAAVAQILHALVSAAAALRISKTIGTALYSTYSAAVSF
jgi:hypothetical protein